MLIVRPTTILTSFDGQLVRVWDGQTPEGGSCLLFVHRQGVKLHGESPALERYLQGLPRLKELELYEVLKESGSR